jgi:hypothetical protein
MLPIRHKTIFKNRWWALLWAGGIVWSAVEFAGGQPHSTAEANSADNDQAADVQAVANAFGAIK